MPAPAAGVRAGDGQHDRRRHRAPHSRPRVSTAGRAPGRATTAPGRRPASPRPAPRPRPRRPPRTPRPVAGESIPPSASHRHRRRGQPGRAPPGPAAGRTRAWSRSGRSATASRSPRWTAGQLGGVVAGPADQRAAAGGNGSAAARCTASPPSGSGPATISRPGRRAPRAAASASARALGVRQVLLPEDDPARRRRATAGRDHLDQRPARASRRSVSTTSTGRASPCAASPSSEVDASAWKRRGIRPARAGQPARLDRVPHRRGHPRRVVGPGDRAGEQHRVAAELHRQRRVRGGADAGVEDHRHVDALPDQPDVVRVARCPARSRSASRPASPRRSPTSASRRARIGSSLVYGSTVNPSADQRLGRRAAAPPPSGSSVRSSPITSSLTQVGLERVAGQVGGLHRVARRCSSRRCSAAPARRSRSSIGSRPGPAGVDPAQRDRDQLGAGRPRSPPPARRGCGAPPVPRISRRCSAEEHRQPPCAAVSTSTRSPSRSGAAAQVDARHHLAVDRDRDPAPGRGQRGDQRRDTSTASAGPASAPLTVRRVIRTSPGAKRRPASGRPSPVVDQVGDQVGGDRGEQHPVAVVPGRPRSRRSVERARAAARCPACRAGGRPIASTSSYSASSGTRSTAARSRSSTPPAVTVRVGRAPPAVAPTTTSPSARGTR